MSRGAKALSVGVLAVAVLVVPVRAAQNWPSEGPPAPLATRRVSFPPYTLKALANGLQVLFVPYHEQPAVSYRLLVRAGAAEEPADRPGVANFVSALLTQGTTTRSATAIANTIDSAGGFLTATSGNELTSIYGAVIKDQTDAALALVSDVAQHPAFSEGEISLQRRQTLSALQVGYDDPEYLAGAVFDRLVFGLHPYGRPNEGTPDSVALLTRADLAAYHQRWFAPNNALLAIVGDLTEEEAFASAEKAFGSWARRTLPDVKPTNLPPPTKRVVIVDRPGSAQTEIRVGHIAIPRTHPDYIPLDMAIRILGGEGANRLFAVLQSDRGLTYGASADLHTFKMSGEVVAETDTRSAATGETLRLMVDEFVRLQKESVNPAELSGAQDFMAGNFPLSIESSSAIAEQVLSRLFYGQNLDEIGTYLDRVRNVTPADVQRVARQILKPDQLSIVLVGDAAAFVDQLRGAGFTQYDRIPIAELDLDSPTLRRASRKPPATGVTLAGAPMTSDVAGSPSAGRRVLVSCGEASGDLYAGALTRELRRIDPAIDVSGFGGPQLAAAGARLVGDYQRLAVTGIAEALAVLPQSWRMLRTIRAEARERRPDVFVAIDFPDFNFRLLAPIHRMGIPIVYYISPQLWAWRPGRIKQIRRYVSKMLVIFPFEVDVYERAGVPVEFVGHPLLELASAPQPRDEWLRARRLDPARPVLALLPGSRPNEVNRLLPVFAHALSRIEQAVPGVQFIVARAPSLPDELFASMASRGSIAVVERDTDAVLAAADAVVTASGTATVQTAIHGKPMVIVYRLSGLTYSVGRYLVKVPHYGMVNLIAGRAVVPELIQDDCTPPRVAEEAVSLLRDLGRADRMRADLADVRARLGGTGASARAAQAVLSAVGGQMPP